MVVVVVKVVALVADDEVVERDVAVGVVVVVIFVVVDLDDVPTELNMSSIGVAVASALPRFPRPKNDSTVAREE